VPPPASAVAVHEVSTPLGSARLHISQPGAEPVGRLVLGHGAGGGVGAPDLVAVFGAATAAGWQVVLVEQPWRVAGGKVAPAPARLDVGWLAAMAGLDDLCSAGEVSQRAAGAPLVTGGRSAGARVACRTADELKAGAVLCLAFPLHPPGRPDRSRAAELAGTTVPVLVVQGAKDPFGHPEEFAVLDLPPRIGVTGVPGDHGLTRPAGTPQAVADAVLTWLGALLSRPAS
jgi:hypothetical protein